MKYAFIDYENLNTLDGLKLNEYERIFLFIGSASNQTDIRLTEKFNDELNITLVTVKEIGKNNVDFHIAYYLGKLDATLDKNIEFYILSKDQGYDGICRFIKQQRETRICQRLTPKSAVENPNKSADVHQCVKNVQKGQEENELVNIAFNEYRNHLLGKGKKNPPKKLDTLRNDLLNRTELRKLPKNKRMVALEKVITKLRSACVLKINDTKVSY